MGKLTDKQKQFLQTHGMWNAKKNKSTLGMFEKGDFQDFFRRKEAVEQDLARLPDEDKKRELTLELQAAEEKARNKQFKRAYRDLEEVKKAAREAGDDYVQSLSLDALSDEIELWRTEGEDLSKFVGEVVSGMETAKSELTKVGKPAPFDSSGAADKFLQSLQASENLLRNQLTIVQNECQKVDNYLGQTSPSAKVKDFGHQISMLQKEKSADVTELTKSVELAHVFFIHAGQTLKGGEFQPSIDQLAQEIDKTIEERKKEATFLANQIYWKERSVTVHKLMLEVLQKGPVERSRIEALWAVADDRAAKGGEADLAAAVTILGDLKTLLDTAELEEKAPEGGGVKEKGEALVKARELQAAQVVLANNAKLAEAALKRIRDEFTPTLPPALNVQAQKLDGLIAPNTETDPAKVLTLAKSVENETKTLDDLAATPRAERITWDQELAAFKLQLASLKSHPRKNDSIVKPLIQKLEEDLGKAELDATATKWTEATAAVKLLVPRCEKAMQTADGIAHFKAIRDDRSERILTLPTGVIAHDQPREAVAAAKKLLTDADSEKNAGKYPEAIALLHKIPAAVDRAMALVNAAKKYDDELWWYDDAIVKLGQFTGDAAAAIQAGVVQFTDRVNNARIAVTNDFATSVTLLGQTDGQFESLKAKATQVKEYKEALDAFEIRFTAVKDHKGRIAIEDFYVRMENDRTFANSRKLAGEFHTGTKILTATQPLHAEQIALAGIAENYKAKHKKAGEDITALENEANGPKAAEVLAEAKRRITVAENTATAKDWPGALTAIEKAEASIADARKLLADDKALGDLKDTGKLDNIEKDFDAAFGVYQAMRQHVASKDPGNVFATKLATADAPALRCREAAGTSMSNFVEARKELDAAIAICEETLLLVTKKGLYDAALPALKTAHDTTLPGINEDGCIDQKIEEIGKAIAGLDKLVKAPTFNFDGAMQQIGATWPKVRDAELDTKAYKAMKPDVQTVTDAIAYLKDPDRIAGVADEIKRLEDAGKAINDDVTAGKIPDAAKKASAAAKICPGLRAIGDAYEIAAEVRQDWVVSRLPEIEGVGKEACAQELKKVKAAIAEMQGLMNDHVYSAVRKIANDTHWVIEAAVAILADAQAYEPKRLAAETKLTNTLPNRNPATEERYDALRDRYDQAVATAHPSVRNYERAKKMVEGIPVECDNLAADAQVYRDYETSRENAGKKLGEAMKDKNAESVRPLLTQLQSRHAAAVKIANAGDYAGAKKLLDDILADAEKALLAATEARNYAAAAEDIKKPGTDIFDAIDKAEKIYKDLIAKPEALYAVSTLGGINNKIKAARDKASSDEDGARYGLIEIVDACAEGRILISHYEQMESQMKALKLEIDTLITGHAQKLFVEAAGKKLLGDIEAARGEARSTGDHVKATKQLSTIDTTLIGLRRSADAHVKYIASKGAIDTDLKSMEEHGCRYAIVKEIAAVRENLAKAATKEDAHDHKAAMDFLEVAAGIALDALLKAKMHKQITAPTVDEVKKILDGKDGPKRLDAIIETLDAKARRRVLDVAFAARFDCKLTRFADKASETSDTEDTDKVKKAPDVRRFYDLMSQLPDTHTKDNDSMQVFVQVGGGAAGSDYTGGRTRKVAMREGDVATSGAYGVSLPQEIDEVEPGCETEPGEPITFFNWNTVHEVGHAVDDKLSFMNGKGKSYAGWIVHGGNVLPIAEAVAEKYDFDAAYVAQYMIKASAVGAAKTASDRDPTNLAKSQALADAEAAAKDMASAAPNVPDGYTPDEWERKRVACCAWVDSARAGNRPWSSASTAKSLAIGGRVYQQSYDDGRWSSYRLDARKQGVTGYQFRAPGEWFSELYAAFHTKKLKPSHPAYSWLQTL